MGDSLPVLVAVVGHTNTGKTSLLRTLTRNRHFGEVADEPGTTRHVEAAQIMLGGKPALRWFDTPGLEDSMGLRDCVDALAQPGHRLDGPDRIQKFLSDPAASRSFEQEHRVMAQVVRSDAILYVVDARDPVLAKHRDEIDLLQACAKPLLPVLNFTARPGAQAQRWVDMFARHGIHITLSFDTVSPPINGEQTMYATLGQLMSSHRSTFEALIAQAQAHRQTRLGAALKRLSELCVTAAAARQTVPNQPEDLAAGVAQQREAARAMERQTVSQLLGLYEFDPEDYLPPGIDLRDGQWTADLFSPQTLAVASIALGKGAAVGAVAGAAVDVMSAGLSLGTGTLIGAAVGSAWQGVGQFGSQLMARLTGRREIGLGNDALMVLAARNLRLIVALEQRGHAAQSPILLDTATQGLPFDGARFLKALATARLNPAWAHPGDSKAGSTGRARAVESVSVVISESGLLRDLGRDGVH